MPAPTTEADGSSRGIVLVDFALQGGGAHGAFTWGALDRLLEEPWLQIDGIAGTSAGAMNGAVLIDGSGQGGGGRSARPLGELLAEGLAGSVAEPAAARVSGRAPRPLELGPFARLHRYGSDGPAILALRPEPARVQPPAADPRRLRRLRADRAGADQAVCLRHKRPHRPRSRIPQPRDHTRRPARLRLPADYVPGSRNRRRALLGWRLLRQPQYHAVGAGV